MSAKSRTLLLVATVAAGFILCNGAWAQQNKDSSKQPDSSKPNDARRYSVARPVQDQGDTDHMVARMLGNMNKVEVELTQYAEDRGDIDSINRFARNQNRQHSMNLEELQQFAPDAGTGIGRSAADNNRTNDSSNQTPAAFDWRQVSQEIANEKLRVAKKELRDRDGLDFDWAFVGQQQLLHDGLCAEMTVLRRYASPPLRDVIDNQLAEVKQDKSALENLMGQLKQEEQRRAAGGRQNSTRRDTSASTGGRGRMNGNQAYVDEFAVAEADFTTAVRLADGPNGRPTLGVQIDQRANDRAEVIQVRPGSPAEKAQLQPGDVILAVNGHPINSPDDLVREVSRMSAGDRVELAVDRSFAGERRIPVGTGNDSDRRQNPRSNRQPGDQQPGNSRNDHNTSY